MEVLFAHARQPNFRVLRHFQYFIIIRLVLVTTACPVDVIFVLDESGSVHKDNFEVMKSFLSQLVGKLDIDSGNTRVGLVTYSTYVDTAEAFNLNAHSSTASVQSAISSLTYSRGATHTAAALRYVRTDMLTSVAGDRPKTANVVFVLTDGESNVNETQTKVCTSAGNVRRKT